MGSALVRRRKDQTTAYTLAPTRGTFAKQLIVQQGDIQRCRPDFDVMNPKRPKPRPASVVPAHALAASKPLPAPRADTFARPLRSPPCSPAANAPLPPHPRSKPGLRSSDLRSGASRLYRAKRLRWREPRRVGAGPSSLHFRQHQPASSRSIGRRRILWTLKP